MTKEITSLKAHQGTSSSQVPEIPCDAIEQAVKGIKHGVVQLIIQDGRVIQINKTEKIRLI